jgi:Flp pilus assembly pilin Flp
MTKDLVRLLAEEKGQDLVEYALLASIIGIAGLLVLPSIRTKMSAAFVGWGSGVSSIWIPENPQ